MRHLVIGQRQKSPNFSAFHWSPHGCLITIGQHFVTMRVVHLPKRTETSLITESYQSRANHQLLQLGTVRTAWSDSYQAVRAVHTAAAKAGLVLTIRTVNVDSRLRNFYFIFFLCSWSGSSLFSKLHFASKGHNKLTQFGYTVAFRPQLSTPFRPDFMSLLQLSLTSPWLILSLGAM